jgi:hypothetical protein
MSVNASIDIKVESAKGAELIEKLFASNWNFNDNGQISYIPLHDTDFDWIRVDLNTVERVKQELIEKISHNEVLGIIVVWKNSEIGGVFNYFTSSNELSLMLTINRKIIDNTNFTDFSWYLERLAPIFESIDIERIVCSDVP